MRRLGALLLVAVVLGTSSCSMPRGSTGENAPGSSVDVAALGAKAATLTDALAANDWAAVRHDFDATMRSALDEAGLQDTWRQVTAEAGRYRSRGTPSRRPTPGAVLVFDTPMTFERRQMKSRLTFHPEGTVAGLYILLADVP